MNRSGATPRRPLRRASPARPTPASLPEDSLGYAIDRAAELVEGVIAGKALSELTSTSGLNRLPAPVRGAVMDLTYTCLRAHARGDAILSRLLSKPLPPRLHAILLVALERLVSRPDTAHTVVDQAVSAIGQHAPGLRPVANGVLRNAVRQKDTFDASLARKPNTRWCHPTWWIERLQADFPDDWEAICEAGNTHPPMSLRANLRRHDLGTARAALDAAGLAHRTLENGALRLDNPVPVDQVPGFADGDFSVQDAGAQWAAQWLDAQDGERVLDACAAPGGKSAHILERTQVALTALELDPDRATRIRDTLARLGLEAQVQVGDAARPDTWWDGVPFDRILADVPCSASGVARRNPDIKWLRREQDITGFARQQAAILDALWRVLAPGGTMLYVTCSVFEEENGAQIQAFCKRHKNAERIAILGKTEHRLRPDADHDGFYYALLRKTP